MKVNIVNIGSQIGTLRLQAGVMNIHHLVMDVLMHKIPVGMMHLLFLVLLDVTNYFHLFAEVKLKIFNDQFIYWSFCVICWTFSAEPITKISQKYIAVEAIIVRINARRYCIDVYHTDFATVTDQNDNDEIYNLISYTSTIGYDYSNETGQYSWLSGDSTYTNWAGGSPNAFREDYCTQIYKIMSKIWHHH